MENQQGVSIAEQPQEESKMKKYLRITFIAVSIILFLGIIVGAIVRKLG
jgi:hypothetical protein